LNELILDEGLRLSLNSDENIKTYDYQQDIKSKDETINQIIVQYDDKMKRLSGELEKAEDRNLNLNEKNKNLIREVDALKGSFDRQKQFYELSIQNMLQNSNEILIQLKNTLEVDLTEDTLKEDVFRKLKNEIKGLSKDEEWKWLSELRSSLGKILSYYLEIIYKHIECENSHQLQRSKWSQTLDQLTLSHDEEINKSIVVII
jgi:hypothetical protein